MQRLTNAGGMNKPLNWNAFRPKKTFFSYCLTTLRGRTRSMTSLLWQCRHGHCGCFPNWSHQKPCNLKGGWTLEFRVGVGIGGWALGHETWSQHRGETFEGARKSSTSTSWTWWWTCICWWSRAWAWWGWEGSKNMPDNIPKKILKRKMNQNSPEVHRKVGLRLNHKLWRMKKPSWRVTKEHQVICICLYQFDNVLQKLKLANEVHNQKVKAVRQSLCVLIPTQRSQNPVQSSRERLCIAQLLQEIWAAVLLMHQLRGMWEEWSMNWNCTMKMSWTLHFLKSLGTGSFVKRRLSWMRTRLPWQKKNKANMVSMMKALDLPMFLLKSCLGVMLRRCNWS